MKPGLLIRITRAPFLTAVIIPVIIGTAVALRDIGSVNVLYFLLAMLGASFIHLGVNVSNDYFDHRSGNDAANKTPTPFSGGSRIIQDGIMSPEKVLSISAVFLAAGALVGAYFYTVFGIPILLIGLAGAVLGVFYTAPPFKLGYRGLGELSTGIGFGVIVVLGSYYVQTATVTAGALLASVPIAVLVALILFINEFPDYNADKAVNKRTLVVLLGKKRAVKLYQAGVFFVYVYIAAMVALSVFPVYVLITFITLPLAVKSSKIAGKHYNNIGKLLPANAGTIKTHLALGLLFAAGYVISSL